MGNLQMARMLAAAHDKELGKGSENSQEVHHGRTSVLQMARKRIPFGRPQAAKTHATDKVRFGEEEEGIL